MLSKISQTQKFKDSMFSSISTQNKEEEEEEEELVEEDEDGKGEGEGERLSGPEKHQVGSRGRQERLEGKIEL